MVKAAEINVVERDESGRTYKTRFVGGKLYTTASNRPSGRDKTRHLESILEFLGKVFLPAGYPDSVSPDYLRYQVLNALQAFCSSLATLISNRGVLEGMGVGDASATATDALLLTVLQDVFSRFTTIIGAYYFGSSLYPEAKLYRLLADVLNDAAIILDALSPLLIYHPSSSSRFNFPGIRVAALCLSSSFRALCGLTAGGSKAAITLHFASPVVGKGDVGDLNAKDASKETVLALTGMLLGTLIVPHLTTAWTIYPVLFFLIFLHLAINYFGVRGLLLRSLNRQRATIAWLIYTRSCTDSSDGKGRILNPTEVAHLERIFDVPGTIRDPLTHHIIGKCDIGTASVADIMKGPPTRIRYRIFDKEKYILCHVPLSSHDSSSQHLSTPRLRLHIFLKEGHTHMDHLKAWAHATEAAFRLNKGEEDEGVVIEQSYTWVESRWDLWLREMRKAGWNIDEGAVLAGAPKMVILEVSEGLEDRKDI